jgi:hypothetical protein
VEEALQLHSAGDKTVMLELPPAALKIMEVGEIE